MEQRVSTFLSSLPGRLRAMWNWEVGIYASLMAIALVLHLCGLEWRAFSNDEFTNLRWAGGWDLFYTNNFAHHPEAHGPFQAYATFISFSIFGDSEFSVRLPMALFGTALVGLPYFLRHQLGRWGAIAAATMLTFSPAVLFFGRYARADIYIIFWMLLLVVCMWRYFEERKARYLYISAAALSCSICTKEGTFITVALFSVFLFIISAKGLWRGVRNKFDLKDLPAPAEYLIFLVTLIMPISAAAVQLIPGVNIEGGLSNAWAKAILVVLCLLAVAIGLRWNWRRWLISAAIFYAIFILIYSGFLTNTAHLSTGFWGSLHHWIERADRVTGPWYYYIVLIPTYEFLPLLFASVGSLYYTIKGNVFSRFLIYWMVLSIIPYSYYGERFPQMSLYIILPAILLAGMFIVQALRIPLYMWGKANAQRATNAKELVMAPFREDSKGWAIPWMTGAAIGIALILLFSYTLNISFQANYQQTDEPPEILVYAGSCYEVYGIMERIEELAAEDAELLVTIDNDLYNPFAWFLRDYNFEHPSMADISSVPSGSVLIIRVENEPDETEAQYLEKYGEGVRFRRAIWFSEQYKVEGIGEKLKWWWGYFFNHSSSIDYYYWEGIAYFPKEAP